MIDLLLSDPIEDPTSFWISVPEVQLDELVSMYEDNGKHSWTYNGKDIVWLPELPVSDVLFLMNIHKLFNSIPDSYHKADVEITGDYFGLIPITCKPYKYIYMDIGDDHIRERNSYKPTYVLGEQEIVKKHFILNDHIDKLFDIDDVYDAYMFTKVTDRMSIMMFDYLLKGVMSIDVDYYFNIERLITCGEYTLIKIKRVDKDDS
jgi:hypothetical protein